MFRRRVAILLSCLAVLVLAAAAAPWTLPSQALRAAAAAQIKDLYGLELSVGGRATIAFLPVPRLKFENILIAGEDGRPIARGGWLRAELRPASLLKGRLDFSELSLRQSDLDLLIDESGGGSLDKAVARLRERFAPQSPVGHVKRFVLERVNLRVRGADASSAAEVRNIHLTAAWASPSAPVEIDGSMLWRGETVEVSSLRFQPSAIAAGRPSRLAVDVKAPLGHLLLNGDLTWADEPRFAGRAVLESASLQGFSAWSGLHLPLGQLIQAFSLEGDLTATRQGLSWPAARISLAGDRLEGAVLARVEGDRAMVSGTLAADRLDLTGVLSRLLREPSTSDGVKLENTRPELDLRLSAADLRVGSLRLADLAANLSITPARSEISIGRVSHGKGVAKGRMVVARAGGSVDVKANTTFERIDAGTLLSELGATRWIGGSAQGQVTVESSGDSLAEMVRDARGRANVTVRQGELVGLALADPFRQVERRALPAYLEWKSGRTAFEQAQLSVAFTDRAADIVDGTLTAPGVRAALQGRLSLRDKHVAIRAHVESAPPAAGPHQAIRLAISGPWKEATILADLPPPAGTEAAAGAYRESDGLSASNH